MRFQKREKCTHCGDYTEVGIHDTEDCFDMNAKTMYFSCDKCAEIPVDRRKTVAGFVPGEGAPNRTRYRPVEEPNISIPFERICRWLTWTVTHSLSMTRLANKVAEDLTELGVTVTYEKQKPPSSPDDEGPLDNDI
jgi:hypothetical protein